MYQDKRRKSPRDRYQAPILISDKVDGGYINALMQNNSMNGMCLTCKHQLDSDTCVYINMLETGNSDIYRGFFGRVKWCRGMRYQEDYQDHFDVGIHLIVKSHTYFGGIGYMIDGCCDVCGKKMPFSQMIRTDDFIFQCRNCHDTLKKYPKGNLKSSIENFILGNIL